MTQAGIFAKIASQRLHLCTPQIRTIVNRVWNEKEFVRLLSFENSKGDDKVDNFLQIEEPCFLEVQRLIELGIVIITTSDLSPIAELTIFKSHITQEFNSLEVKACYKMSRFAYIITENNLILIKTPKSPKVVKILDPSVLFVFHTLSTGCVLKELLDNCCGNNSQILSLLYILYNSSMILKCDPINKLSAEETDSSMMQWEFHDLVMHSASRFGRTEEEIGGSFRFKGVLKPEPALKPKSYDVIYIASLPKPQIWDSPIIELNLLNIIENRTSVRKHGAVPVSILQLSEFLFRICRIRQKYLYEGIEFTNRPYPNGGASYELEFYLTVNKCWGLASGFYHYDPDLHALELLKYPCADTQQLLADACQAASLSEVPQVVITFSSRFQRVSWKYKGIAYATQLKNVGVVMAYMYLVATSLNLAPCALGSGNSDLFCRLAETNYYKETSIGEFMIGTKTY